jgi:TolA-binding protein
MTMLKQLCGLLAVLTMTSCVTVAREKEIRKDIFDIQTRMMRFEQVYEKQTGDTARQKFAAAATELDRVRTDINRLNGDVDALRMGVQSGKMPGTPDTPETVAARLKGLEDKLTLVQTAQEEILQLLEKGGNAKGLKASKADPDRDKGDKAGKDDKTAKTDAGEGVEFKNFGAMKSAFQKNRFRDVSEAAPKVIHGLKGKDKDEAIYMYAESLFRSGNTLDAALQFNNYMDTKPRRERVAHSKLRLGDCFRAQGDVGTAKIYFQEIIKEFPTSSEAKRSKERLADLSKGGGSKSAKADDK